ncbi:MAG: hypothetical protein HQ559_08810 [Lentisphaerae bacterium]|nr:hypothetical protein [Lentisphaerota bacterium]
MVNNVHWGIISSGATFLSLVNTLVFFGDPKRDNAPDPMLPGFVAFLIQTPFFLELVQFNRVGAVKQRMYTENLCQIRIPYLPKTEQRKYAKARESALAALHAAEARLADTRKDVEAMILGTKPVPTDSKLPKPGGQSR